MRGNSHDNLRRAVARKLGRRVSDAEFRVGLNRYTYRGDVDDDEEQLADDIADYLRSVEEIRASEREALEPETVPERDGGGRQKRGRAGAADEEVRRRAEAVTHVLACLARQERVVVRFRDRFLFGADEDLPATLCPGRLLTPEEATTFLGSAALRLLSTEYLVHDCVPLVGHAATVTHEVWQHERAGWLREVVTVRIDPPGIERRISYAVHQAALFSGGTHEAL